MIATSNNNFYQNAEHLSNVCKELSREVLKSHSQIREITISEYPAEFAIHGHLMGLTQISTDFAKIIFKNYFYTKDLAHISSVTFKKNPQEMSQKQLIDFSKEYCNLMGGRIKSFFEINGCRGVQSLPMILNSFDDIYFNKKERNKLFRFFWTLNYGEYRLINSLAVEITDEKSFRLASIAEMVAEFNEGQFEAL
jgi:hypothetical protein